MSGLTPSFTLPNMVEVKTRTKTLKYFTIKWNKESLVVRPKPAVCRCSATKMFLKFRKIYKKTPVLEPLFYTVAGFEFISLQLF